MKSPINYKDNHKSSLGVLKKIIPRGSVVSSFLFYSGEIELALSSTKRFISSYTNKYPVYEFWDCMQKDPKRINDIISSDSFKSFNNQRSFNILQENWLSYHDPYMRAAIFLFLNWTSDVGLISSGKFEKLSNNPLRYEKVTNFNPRNFHLSLVESSMTIFDSIKANSGAQYTLIPMGRFNYNLLDEGKQAGIEQTIINHSDFHTFIKSFSGKCIILYKNHASVRKIYKDFNIKMIDKYGNIANQDNCEELIVTNF